MNFKATSSGGLFYYYLLLLSNGPHHYFAGYQKFLKSQNDGRRQVGISGQCMRNWKIEQVCNNKHINSKYILSTSTLGVSQIEKVIRMFLFIFNLVFLCWFTVFLTTLKKLCALLSELWRMSMSYIALIRYIFCAWRFCKYVGR